MNPILSTLAEQVTKTTTVEASARALIDGFATRLADAVSKALANGATAEELAPVQAEVDALKQSSSELATAIEANTPTTSSAPKKRP